MSDTSSKPENTALKPRYFQVVFLCLVSLSVYINSLWNGFVYDDTPLVLQNTWIRDVSNIPAIFKNGLWAFQGDVSNYYRPMAHLVSMLCYYLFGLAPAGFHLVNILLHTAVCVLVFVVTGRLLRDSGLHAADKSYVPLLTAAVFSVHPVHTESVAWVAGVPDVLYTLFYLLAFYFYMIARSGRHSAIFAAGLSVGSYFVAMLCKEPAVTLPAVLLGYDYAVKKDRYKPLDYIKRYLPYISAIVIYFVIRQAALGGFSPNPARYRLGPYLAAVNIPALFSMYVEMMLLPVGLNVSHPFHPLQSMLDPAALLGMAVSAGFAAALIMALKKRSLWSMGLLLVVIPLLPALYIPGLSKDVFSERYLYLPVFGFALLMGLTYELAASRLPGLKKILAVFVAALIAACSVWTIKSNKVWANPMTLWSHSIKIRPDNPFAHTALGEAYLDEGLLDKAIAEYKASIGLDDKSSIPHLGLAIAYTRKNMTDEAIAEGEAALGRAEGYGHVLALIHGTLGAAYARKGLLDKAEEELTTAIGIDPAIPEAHSALGAVYKDDGRLDMAVEELETALKLSPLLPEAHSNYGVAIALKGYMDDAIEHCTMAVELAPGSPEFRNNLGIVYLKAGYPDMAKEQFEEARRLDPDGAASLENLRRTAGRGEGNTR